MACSKVTFSLSRAGQTTAEALRNCVNDSLPAAFQLCSMVNSECPEPAYNPEVVEFVDARPTGTEIIVRAKFTYQCHPVGQGCLTAPLMSLFSFRQRPERPDMSRSLDELLGLEAASSGDEQEHLRKTD